MSENQKYTVATHTISSVAGSAQERTLSWIEGPGLEPRAAKLHRATRSAQTDPIQISLLEIQALAGAIRHSSTKPVEELLTEVLPWLEAAYSAGVRANQELVREAIGLRKDGTDGIAIR